MSLKKLWHYTLPKAKNSGFKGHLFSPGVGPLIFLIGLLLHILVVRLWGSHQHLVQPLEHKHALGYFLRWLMQSQAVDH